MKLATQERINERIVEVQVPQFREETVEVMELAPQERINELFVDVSVPQIFEEAVEVVSQD